MTHFLQRSALIFLATTALCASPALAKTHAPAAKAPPAAANGKIVTLRGERADYVVKKGDTLAKIADTLDTTVAELMSANKLKKSSVLLPGDTLKGPAVPVKAYVVAHGDTVFSIARRFHVTVDDLRGENSLSAKAQIHSGQQIRLPAGYKAPSGVADEAVGEVTDTGGSQRADAAPAKGAKGRKAKSLLVPIIDETPAPGDPVSTGRVTTREARGETYKAKKGDTLAKVSERLGADVAEVKRLNHIKGTAIHAGQVYRGPSFAEHVYVVVRGDTLASIAERFSVSVASLRAENEMPKRVANVRPGQKVFLPDGYRDRNAGSEERPTRSYLRPVGPSPTDAQPPSSPQPYQPSGQPPRPYAPPPAAQTPSATAAPSTPAPSDAQVSQMGKGRFQWPIKGDVVSDFGPKAGGQRNDGINIQAEAGSAIHAAADGDVVYAGDQVPGFGNLVLIKHADGWVTAYGHLSHIDVKMQQKVTQGQQIGQAGNSGGVPEPQLHFEVRYAPNPLERARPVDPKLVLPK
jgi:murein DD-endopeptidase MepM/ murein hydrolase activator NlpD